MFDRDFLARGLEKDVPCEMPVGAGKYCGELASWSVPVGKAFLPCCPAHMEGALQIYRANKLQHRMFQLQLEPDQESQNKQDSARLKEPETEGFRNDLFPGPPKRKRG